MKNYINDIESLLNMRVGGKLLTNHNIIANFLTSNIIHNCSVGSLGSVSVKNLSAQAVNVITIFSVSFQVTSYLL